MVPDKDTLFICECPDLQCQVELRITKREYEELVVKDNVRDTRYRIISTGCQRPEGRTVKIYYARGCAVWRIL